MKKRSAYIVALVLASIILPMCVGALRGIGLSRAADGNQTFAFAQSYYSDVIEGSGEYARARDRFSRTGPNKFGLMVQERSPCQVQLVETWVEEDQIVSSALSNQRSEVLQQIFDEPGIVALEALPSPLVGALAGCRYTLASTICVAWSRKIISRANSAKFAALQREGHNWLTRNEAASCKTSSTFGAKEPNT
jgi:hypothetical protein